MVICFQRQEYFVGEEYSVRSAERHSRGRCLLARRLKSSFIEEYMHFISGATESPTKYHFWAISTCISAALRRHVWFDRKTFKLYPNLYTILVGRPGLGKGAAMHPALALLKDSGVANILSGRITMEYVLEKLSKGFPAFSHSPIGQSVKVGSDSAVLIVSSELSVFISASQFAVTALTDLWDTNEGVYSYGTRGKGEFNIANPYVSLLGGSAQEWLVKSIPSDAVGGGFTRRVNFVLASKKGTKIPWPSMNHSKVKADLVADLQEISQLRGEYTIAPSARETFESVYDASEPEEFDDEATAGYKTSRWANALKLAMVLSASRGDSLVIQKPELELAISKTMEVSADIPLVFRSVGESNLTSATDKVLRFVEIKGYASRAEILKANWRHLTSEDLDRIIVTMREAGILGERCIGNKTEYFNQQKAQEAAP